MYIIIKECMVEYTYIKNMVIKLFNNQFGKTLNVLDFDLICISKKPDYPYAFEIFTVDATDQFRLRVYLNIGSGDKLEPFWLEVNSPYYDTIIRDEVWVTLGSLDIYHLESGFMKETNLLNCLEQVMPYVLDENGDPILDEILAGILLE